IGLDSPGLVSKLTTRVFELNGNIIDVEENCRRGLFSIFLIIDFSGSNAHMQKISEGLSRIGEETGLKVVLGIYQEDQIAYSGEKENHVVTILGEDKPGIIANMKLALRQLCRSLNQSVVIQSENIFNRGKKLVVFDVESSLLQESSLEDFLKRIEGRVKAVEGEVEIKNGSEDRIQALLEHARILRGIPLADLEKFSDKLQLNPGALELIGILKSMGFKIALLSSGFSFLMKRIFEQAGVDYAFSNSFKSDEKGIITGDLQEPVITNETKSEILDFIMSMEGLKPEQVIAVGDGSTRSHFIRNVGLSIAFKPEDTSVDTDGILSTDRISHILYCLGIPKAELDKHLKRKPVPPASGKSF
ncbi:MAG: phosphoserine phosphatase SerB, partial [Deltaproteobacteria bacterium]|nr:phosphoserine phosphatase SerB [Deltaproteobacteria bacterium]